MTSTVATICFGVSCFFTVGFAKLPEDHIMKYPLAIAFSVFFVLGTSL